MTRVGLQFAQMLCAFGLGLSLGIIYDIYRLFIKKNRGGIWCLFGDLLWWLAALVWTFFLLVKISWAELRIPVILAVFLGIIIYLYYFSPVLSDVYKKFFWLLKKIFKTLFDLLIKIIGIIFAPLVWISSILYNIYNFLKKILLKIFSVFDKRITNKKAKRKIKKANKKNAKIQRKQKKKIEKNNNKHHKENKKKRKLSREEKNKS